MNSPNKEELLEKAKRDYPVGTRYKLPVNMPYDGKHKGKDFTVESKWFTYGSHGNLHPGSEEFTEEGDYAVDGCVYYRGQWAEILPEPVVDFNSDLELGITNGFIALDPKDSEITRLTQELKETKEYREKVKEAIDRWSDKALKNHFMAEYQEYALRDGAKFMRDQFKQIK